MGCEGPDGRYDSKIHGRPRLLSREQETVIGGNMVDITAHNAGAMLASLHILLSRPAVGYETIISHDSPEFFHSFRQILGVHTQLPTICRRQITKFD